MAYLEIGPRPRWPHPFLLWAVIGVVLIKRVVEVVNSFSFLFGLGQSFRTKLASTWSCSAASSRPFFLVDSITCKKEGEMKVEDYKSFLQLFVFWRRESLQDKKVVISGQYRVFLFTQQKCSIIVWYLSSNFWIAIQSLFYFDNFCRRPFLSRYLHCVMCLDPRP